MMFQDKNCTTMETKLLLTMFPDLKNIKNWAGYIAANIDPHDYSIVYDPNLDIANLYVICNIQTDYERDNVSA